MASDSDSDSDYEIISAKTRVFWDIEDFPVPDGGNINSFPMKIKRSLYIMGYDGEVSFMVYSGKISEKSQYHLKLINIGFTQEADEKFMRLDTMLLDMVCWAYHNPPSGSKKEEVNFMVIAKDIPKKETDFAETLKTLKTKGYNVFLVVPDADAEAPFGDPTLTWHWDRLFVGEEARFQENFLEGRAHSAKRQKTSEDADCENEPNIISVKTIPCRDYTNAKTTVFWDVVDFPMPVGRSFYKMIKSGLEAEGYHGKVSVMAYGEKTPQDMNLNDGVFTSFVETSDKYRRLIKMMLDVGWWVMENPEPMFNPTNLMVIAKNIKERTDFANFLLSLSSMDYNVLFVLPEDSNPREVEVPELSKVWYWETLLAGGERLKNVTSLAQQFWELAEEKEEEEEEDKSPCLFCSGVEYHNI